MPAWNNFFINIVNVLRKRKHHNDACSNYISRCYHKGDKYRRKCRLAADPARIYDAHIWFYIRIITIKSSSVIHGRLLYMDEFLYCDAHVRSHHTWYETDRLPGVHCMVHWLLSRAQNIFFAGSMPIYLFPGVLDREGHGHKAVVYKSHFPPLRHSFSQRHHCIHRLINHVYTKGTTSLLSIAPRHGGSSDKTLRSPEY